MLGHHQLHAKVLCLFGRSFAGIALIDISDLDIKVGRFLHAPGQLGHLLPILFIGWRDMQSQQMT